MTDNGSKDAVTAAIAREFPGKAIADRTTIAAGNRKQTVLVRLSDTVETVGDAKSQAVAVQTSPDGADLRTEAALARSIASRTVTPVPPVIAGGTLSRDGGEDRFGDSYLISEHAPGSDLHEHFTTLDSDQRKAVARSFGRVLAAVHNAFIFDGYGAVDLDGQTDEPTNSEDYWGPVLEPFDPGSLLRVDPDSNGRVEVTKWPSWFERYAEAGIRALPEAFDDIRPRLCRAVADATKTLSTAPPAHLYPWDLRPGNALVADGRLSAVLDWGQPLAADPGLSVAKTEHLVCDWYVDDGSPLRCAFRDGYRSERPLPTVPDVYRLVTVVRSAVDGDGIVTRPRYPEKSGEQAVAFHRNRLRALLDG